MKKKIKILIAVILCILALMLLASGATLLNALFSDYKAETGVVSSLAENSFEPETKVKVVTFNIAYCKGPKTFEGMSSLAQALTIESPEQVYKCLDNIAEMLKAENTDIALLQEVNKKAVWSYGIDFAPYLSEKTGMGYYAYGAMHDFVWWPSIQKSPNRDVFFNLYFDTGNAIISRFPIISAENKAYDRQSFIGWIVGKERYLDTVIDIEGKNVRAISAHFNSNEAEERVKEARRLVSEAQDSEMPNIIGGDFNAILDEAKPLMPYSDLAQENDITMRIFRESGLFNLYMERVDPADADYYTSNTMNPYRTLDFIIPTKSIEIKEYYVVDVELSDHKPVAAVLEVKS